MRKTKLTAAQRKARGIKITSGSVFYVSALVTISANMYASKHTPVGLFIGLWTPVAFFMSLELIERIPGAGAIKWVRNSTIGFLAAVAGWASYWHLVKVLHEGGVTDPVSLYLMPLTVDVLMVVARMAMNAKAPSRPALRRPAAKREQAPQRKLKVV